MLIHPLLTKHRTMHKQIESQKRKKRHRNAVASQQPGCFSATSIEPRDQGAFQQPSAAPSHQIRCPLDKRRAIADMTTPGRHGDTILEARFIENKIWVRSIA